VADYHIHGFGGSSVIRLRDGRLFSCDYTLVSTGDQGDYDYDYDAGTPAVGYAGINGENINENAIGTQAVGYASSLSSDDDVTTRTDAAQYAIMLRGYMDKVAIVAQGHVGAFCIPEWDSASGKVRIWEIWILQCSSIFDVSSCLNLSFVTILSVFVASILSLVCS